MKKWMVLYAALVLAAGTAIADVANEVIVGLEGDSTSKATDNTGADITDKVENDNSLFTVQYTHFFSPLKDDGKPIELRRFYQHPSTLSAGLAFRDATEKDSTVPAAVIDAKMNRRMFHLGGELYLPKNTGFFLNIGAGSGTIKGTLGGVALPDTDLKIRQFGLGVRKYIGENVALHLRLARETDESTPSGGQKITNERSDVFLGARGVIADMVGLALELGGDGLDLAVNAEIAGYIGRHMTVLLEYFGGSKDLQGTPTRTEQTIQTERTTLAVRYWFSESFGLEVPFYSEKVWGGGGSKDEITNKGIGLYTAFRF